MPASKTGKHLKSSRHADCGAMSSKTVKNRLCSSPASSLGSPSSENNYSREARNRAEKKRRDKLNSYITELATLVPMVYTASKRPDKIGILRLSAAYLRLYYSSFNAKTFQRKFAWWPDFLENDYFSDLMQTVEGFFVFSSPSGKIIYVSESVENYLGHHDVEMIGHSLLDYVHPSDLENVKKELKSLLCISTQPRNNRFSDRVTFCAHIRKRSQARSEMVTYQAMQLNCCLSLNEGAIRSNKSHGITTETAGITHANFGGLLKIHSIPLKPNLSNELSISEAFREEYITRHGPDGKILFADHRISTTTGHLPDEVIGMLAYDYINPVDIPVTHFAQSLMFSSSNGTGMVVYRLKTRNETMVYLKSIGHLQYEEGSGTKISHFICVNKLLSLEEGEEELTKFKERYSPRINEFLASLEEQKTGMQAAKANELLQRPECHQLVTNNHSSEFLSYLHQPSSSYNDSLIKSLQDNFDQSFSPNVCDQSVNNTSMYNVLPEATKTSSNHNVDICSDLPYQQTIMLDTGIEPVAQRDINLTEFGANSLDLSHMIELPTFPSETNCYSELSTNPILQSRKRSVAEVAEDGFKSLLENDRKNCKIMKYDSCKSYIRNLDTLTITSEHSNNPSDDNNCGKKMQTVNSVQHPCKQQHSITPENSNYLTPSELSCNSDILRCVSDGNYVFHEDSSTINSNNFQPLNCSSDYQQNLNKFESAWLPNTKIGFFNANCGVQNLDDVLFFQDC